MSCCFVFVNDAVSNSPVKYRNRSLISRLGSGVVPAFNCGDSLFNCGSHCRSLAVVVLATNFRLSGAFLCLGCICHVRCSFFIYPLWVNIYEYLSVGPFFVQLLSKAFDQQQKKPGAFDCRVSKIRRGTMPTNTFKVNQKVASRM